MNCQCEPPASGLNRCAFCRAEDRFYAQFGSAVRLIQQIAKDEAADPSAACDAWLDQNGFGDGGWGYGVKK